MRISRSFLTTIVTNARVDRGWATMVATIEFKHRLPQSSSYSNNTIAMYTSTRFATNGRGDVMSELWSAPPGVVGDSSGVVEEGWRKKMVCLAVMTQMGVLLRDVIPTAVARDRLGSSKL